MRAEEVRHLREQVPVAAAHVEDRLDAVAPQQQRAERDVRHARHRARRVGDVHDVDAAVEQHLRARERLRRVEAGRRVHLDRDHEFPGRDLRGEGAPLGQRRGREDDRRLHGLHRTRPPDVSALVAEHAPGLRHPTDVLGRGAAAATHHRGADLDRAAREDVEVFGRRHIEEAAVHRTRQPGVWLHAQRQIHHAHALGDGERDLRAVAAIHAEPVRAPVAQRRRDVLRP